jgi:hypothetical protein
MIRGNTCLANLDSVVMTHGEPNRVDEVGEVVHLSSRECSLELSIELPAMCQCGCKLSLLRIRTAGTLAIVPVQEMNEGCKLSLLRIRTAGTLAIVYVQEMNEWVGHLLCRLRVQPPKPLKPTHKVSRRTGSMIRLMISVDEESCEGKKFWDSVKGQTQCQI